MTRRLRSDAAANRERILAAATIAVRRDGEKVPMATIADEAGVGIGTVYRHYPTRPALLAALTLRSFNLVLQHARAAALSDEPAPAALEQFFEQTIAARDEFILPLHGGPVIHDGKIDALRTEIRSLLEQVLARGRHDRTIRPDATPSDIIITGAMLAQPLPYTADWDQLARRQARIFVAGLAATDLPLPLKIGRVNDHSRLRVVEERSRLPTDALRALSHRLDGDRKSVDLGRGWERGVPGDWLDALLGDWRVFDTDALQRRLDALRQQRVEVGGHIVHLVHAEGRGPSPMPLLLTHGWPGSFLEYLPVLAVLSDPGAHGADPADAFTVVVPSLPGYGFSGPPPPTGMTGRQVARLWYELMTVGLGYERFVAHGSDLGAGVTAWLARDQPGAVAAIHLATPGLAVAPGPRTAHEEEFARAVQDWTAEEGGYMHEHATKPGTLGAGLSDSPAGLAAWIGEKIVAWSSTRPDGSPAFDRELLLATLTLYWTTETITTSLLPYWAHRHLAGAALPAGDVSPVPTAISIFGGERVPFPKPPRELAERYYNVTSWAEHQLGGHFPAVAEPELLAQSLREAFRPMRQQTHRAPPRVLPPL